MLVLGVFIKKLKIVFFISIKKLKIVYNCSIHPPGRPRSRRRPGG